MTLSDELKQSLEAVYDIPFIVNSGIKDHEPWFEIIPSESHESLFRLLLSYRNGIRLIMNMIPQKYSANMVRAMGLADEEKKKSFTAFSFLMAENGAKIEFAVNENKYDPSHPDIWPTDWNRVSLRATVMPIKTTKQETPDYQSETLKWGNLFTGLTLSLLDIVPVNEAAESDDQPDPMLSGQEEGRKVQFLSTRYERNPINRYICLQNKGYKCSVCGFDFEKQYGEIGKNFIHVHHIIPVSKMGDGYVVDPIEDLAPVCPNCHAMLHRMSPPLSIEELKSKISEKR